MNIQINTKQICRDWYSFVTFKGYDYSENGKTINEAQGKIEKILVGKEIRKEDIIWSKPVYDKRVKLYSPLRNRNGIIGYGTNRLDNL